MAEYFAYVDDGAEAEFWISARYWKYRFSFLARM